MKTNHPARSCENAKGPGGAGGISPQGTGKHASIVFATSNVGWWRLGGKSPQTPRGRARRRIIALGHIFICAAAAVTLASSITNSTCADTAKFEIRVSSTETLHNVPLALTVDLPNALQDVVIVPLMIGAHKSFGQLTDASLLSSAENSRTRELNFILPAINAGQTVAVEATVDADARPHISEFFWRDEVGKHALLSFDKRPVLQYMYEALDDSSPERRKETYKVYHHVYDPAGRRLVTKGPGGLFPHHRGLFFGFNRISYGPDGKQKADTWHCGKGESQAHTDFLSSQSGPVLGRHLLAVDWRGQDGQVFAREQREMTAYRVPGGNLIEFAARLTSTVGKVKLDGDPQHAGFQFRASQHVPDHTKQQTYYLRPDGKDKPGSFRNWNHDRDKGHRDHVNLPWNAMSFVIEDQRYTCCYLDHPQNPKEARFSERDYGRFGSYFEYELTDDNSLQVNYRIWLQEGEMTVPEVAAHSNAFVRPPTVAVKRLDRN